MPSKAKIKDLHTHYDVALLIVATDKTKCYCAKCAVLCETEHHVQVVLCPSVYIKSALAHTICWHQCEDLYFHE